MGTLKLQLELLRTDYDQRLQLLNDENEYLHGCITLFRDQGDQGVYSGTKNKNTQNPHIKVTTRHKNGPKWAKIAVSGILDHIPEF